MKKSKGKFWTLQRLLAIFLMITAILQIVNSVASAQWRHQVTLILQTRHPYFSDTVNVATTSIDVLWWVIVFFGSLLLFIDKDIGTFFEKALKDRD